jgi:hypothetical protein
MAHPHLKAPLDEFTAVVHRTKNRLVAIPAEVQRKLGLERRVDNHLVLVSIREHGGGRWNHNYFKLTYDNEFAIPSNIPSLKPGQMVDVRIHRVIADVPAANAVKPPHGAELLLSLAKRPRKGWRSDGAERIDDYLREES